MSFTISFPPELPVSQMRGEIADAIRDSLAAAGITVEDGADAVTWSVA